ncbi:unnamed protein product [Cylindrotheca closterium]|uniref:ATP-dependent DNA helicase n=1 Tax=Cylindrotheca closterium TaxID=2856 RepID=A0AAD2FWG1_9STRA|nr:unnamed protein product [Cylindrotheca closterium]
MASNNLNAADINGSTIASLLKQRIQKRQKDESQIVQQKISPAAVIGLEKQNVQDLRLIIINEVSNVTASKLGKLSRLFSEVLQSPDQFFGGILVLLVGDFNQKEPVGGILATTSLIKKVKNEIGHSKDTTNSEHRMKKKQKLSIETTTPSLLDANCHNVVSDNNLGCNILAASRWFELTEAERSKDTNHNNNIDSFYNGNPI